jgi:threonylcarbamoyladenosine tRNA methylthiotransferase CDKAL1
MAVRYYLETYGCSLNTADSGVIDGLMQALGGLRVDSVSSAGLIIINTCGVKEPTEDKIIYRLEQLSKTQRPVIVAGCLPRISYHRILNTIPDFAAMIGPQSIEALQEVLPRVLKGERGIEFLQSTDNAKLEWFQGPADSVICTIPICEGCVGDCAYCAVRFARGEVRSYSISEIRRIVSRCIHLGYREIRLTSQDAGVFGYDTGERLPDLLAELGSIQGDHCFRLGMFNPNLVLDSLGPLLDSMDNERFFKFFHVPLQSGSDRVLSSMGRLYTRAQWEKVIADVRGRFPDATIATDIIVGFPGEDDADFTETVETLQRTRPGVVNISKYGDRPGTRASKSGSKVETGTKKERSRLLTKVVNQLVLEVHESLVGQTVPVLVSEPGAKGGWLCRDPSYRPVIVKGNLIPGTRLVVDIVDAKRTHLLGAPTSLV